MRGGTLVTGGSDGSVRVWSLERFCPIHRLAAHDNSVTSLQFDDTRVVSGGSDGRVKVWDLKDGRLVRELIAQGEAVWRVAFEDEKCVAMALRNNRTVMEVRRRWNSETPSDFLSVLLTRIASLGLVLLAPGRDASGVHSHAALVVAAHCPNLGQPDPGPSYERLLPGLWLPDDSSGRGDARRWPIDRAVAAEGQLVLPG